VNTPGDSAAFHIISEPGSYHLAGNLINTDPNSPKHGIVIVSSDVSIDLNGFRVDGLDSLAPPGPQPTAGILASIDSGSLANITVRNGTVRDWNEDGIDLSDVTGARIVNILAANCGDTGIHVGERAVVTGCVGEENGEFGIWAFTGSVVTECATANNATAGFNIGGASIATHCTAFSNGNGFQIGEGCTVTECSARSNAGHGIISSANGSTIRGCTLRGNTGDGIRVNAGALILENNCSFNGSGGDGAGINALSTGCRIEGNSVVSNDRGIEVGDFGGSYIIRNTAQGNTTNYDIGSGNATGVIVTATEAITAIAPWANFEF
jgi:parallel beta-helix repeat protein